MGACCDCQKNRFEPLDGADEETDDEYISYSSDSSTSSSLVVDRIPLPPNDEHQTSSDGTPVTSADEEPIFDVELSDGFTKTMKEVAGDIDRLLHDVGLDDSSESEEEGEEEWLTMPAMLDEPFEESIHMEWDGDSVKIQRRKWIIKINQVHNATISKDRKNTMYVLHAFGEGAWIQVRVYTVYEDDGDILKTLTDMTTRFGLDQDSVHRQLDGDMSDWRTFVDKIVPFVVRKIDVWDARSEQ